MPEVTTQVAAALERAHASQPRLNAFTSIDDEGALARAAGLQHGSAAGLLWGVPVAVKDLIHHAGKVTTAGSAFYAETAAETAPAIAALEREGAVVIGRSGLHEWAFGFSSENPHWGPVRNPWDPSTSAGGSSGGSAAVVAGGVVPLAVGTDTGGSVRVPAALCGTYGLKVTHGAIPLDGVIPLAPTLDTIGPLASSMDLIDAAFRAMSGVGTTAGAGGRLRFGVPQPWVESAPFSGGIEEEFAVAMRRIESEGHLIDETRLEGVAPTRQLWNALAREAYEVHRPHLEAGRPYGDDVAGRLASAVTVTEAQREEARAWQHGLRDTLESAFRGHDFLLTPTVPARRKVIGEAEIGGRHHRSVLSWFTAVVNHALLPALAMPLADSGAPPASLQVIGPPHSEPGLISLGKRLAEAGIVRFTPATGDRAAA